MTTTGYSDAFQRTVTGGMGPADTGQSYSMTSPNSQFNVAPGTASIVIATSGDKYAFVDRHTSDIDITGQVALSAIPASNLAAVGFVVKWASTNYYINATMMVAVGGAVSLRFSKVVAGGLTTVTTVAAGITYVANTFYNLRVAAFWSQALQANVLQSKIWAVGATEPGGWLVNTTETAITPFLAGTRAGIFARDEQAAPGITAKIQNVVSKSYSLPMPATTDPMCSVPATTSASLCSIAISDGTFETAAAVWAGAGGTYARQQATVYDGTWAGQLTAVGAPSQMTLRPNTTAPVVTVGQSYTMTARVRSATAFASVAASIDWFDASFAYLSTSSATTALTANTWTLISVTANAPASAAFASYGPTVSSPTAGQSLFADNIDLQGPCASTPPAYPKQTALQSLATAADTVMAGLDPLTSLAGLFPRVRVSASNIVMPATSGGYTIPWGATEFNIGTPTNLGYDNLHLALPVGIWMLAFDIELAEAASNSIQVNLNGYWNAGSPTTYMRSNAAQSNDQSIGGCHHVSAITYSTDPAATISCSVLLIPTSSSTPYTIKYSSLTAIKISDYFV